MEIRITDREQAIHSSFGYINPITRQFEPIELRQHLINLGIYEEPTEARKLTPELTAYYTELKARIEKYK